MLHVQNIKNYKGIVSISFLYRAVWSRQNIFFFFFCIYNTNSVLRFGTSVYVASVPFHRSDETHELIMLNCYIALTLKNENWNARFEYNHIFSFFLNKCFRGGGFSVLFLFVRPFLFYWAAVELFSFVIFISIYFQNLTSIAENSLFYIGTSNLNGLKYATLMTNSVLNLP